MTSPAVDSRLAAGPISFKRLRAGRDMKIGPITVSDTSAIAAEVRAAWGRVEDLAGRLAVSRNSVFTFLRKIGESDIPDGEEGDKLVEVATRYKVLEKEAELLKAADPQMQWIRAEIEFALTQGDFDLAETLLASAVSQINAVEQLSGGHIAEALVLLRESVTPLEPYIKSNPNYSRLILQIGYILKTQGDALYLAKDNDRAENVLTEALNRFYTVVGEIQSEDRR